MNTSMPLENQLLATKLFMPVTSGTLISRSRLSALLDQSLQYPLTLVSAPAGFGKTTLLSIWAQSLPANTSRLCWVSLDEEDNDPQLFWTYVLSALDRQQPHRFAPLLMPLQSSQSLPLKCILIALIRLLAESAESFVLVLDDYQVITQEQVHTTLTYLLGHLPPQLRIILATRTDPPLPLSLLQTRRQMLEVRTDELRCTAEETDAFFHEVRGIQLPHETIQEVTDRTEGWLVGLQLLGLSLSERADPLSLLEEVSGDQHYILDFLTEEVLRRQPQEVQTFLLCTSILEQLNASLCDAVMEQHGSQQMLQRLEQTNLFVVSLDSRRQWYRYHALFAEALRYRLEQTYGDLVFTLHHRASLWYAKHDRTTQAILHAFCAKEWHWAADLIERKSLQLMTLMWGAGHHAMVLLQEWIKQLPAEVMYSRPSLCLACCQLLWAVAPQTTVEAWLNAAEATLTASLMTQTHEDASSTMLTPQARQDLENRLGEVITFRAVVRGHLPDNLAVFPLCQQALTLLSADNIGARTFVAWAQIRAFYASESNDVVAAMKSGLQAGTLAQAAGKTALAIGIMSATTLHMVGTGRLHEMYQLAQQTIQLGIQPGEPMLPDLSLPIVLQAEVLREWNQLDAALELAEEAISLSPQAATIVAITYTVYGYVVLMRIALSRGELDRACSALQEFERIKMKMNQPLSLHFHSFFTMIDQIRLWLACGELDRATRWAEELDIRGPCGTPFAREREEVARARILLATAQPTGALQRLEPVLQRATAGQRWGHVIEIRLLQALAHQACQQEMQALSCLAEAVRLGQPEGFIRSFVDEGASIEALLYRLRKRERKNGPTPYLDTLLVAFQQESKVYVSAKKPTNAQLLPDPLSERELQVLHLLACGASNLEISQELVITIDTVKRHVSHIFSKLGVQNRVQAVRQARELGLLGEED